jgi:hypothetical protein
LRFYVIVFLRRGQDRLRIRGLRHLLRLLIHSV